MTLFLSLRQQGIGGGTTDPRVMIGKESAGSIVFRPMPDAHLAAESEGAHVLIATHGYNVSLNAGAWSLMRLEMLLDLQNVRFVGVLWPGDAWLPFVNYPFEGSTARDCGRRIARFCNRHLRRASAISFVAHSLGARAVLHATEHLDRRVRLVCLLAAAVDDDCLAAEFAGAFRNADKVAVLASRRDRVLRLAYPLGDAFSGVLGSSGRTSVTALGLSGPKAAIGATVPPWVIPDDADYGHSDYLPPVGPGPLPPQGKWNSPARYIREALSGAPQSWP